MPLLVTAVMADVPLLAMLPLAIGLLAEGRTRMFCQVSKQVTPLLLAVVTVKVICAALLDVIAAEEPLARALMFLFLGPVPADLSTLTVGAVPPVSKTNPLGAFRMMVPVPTSAEAIS